MVLPCLWTIGKSLYGVRKSKSSNVARRAELAESVKDLPAAAIHENEHEPKAAHRQTTGCDDRVRYTPSTDVTSQSWIKTHLKIRGLIGREISLPYFPRGIMMQ